MEVQQINLTAETRQQKFRMIWQSLLVGLLSGLAAVGYRYLLEQLAHWWQWLFQHPATVAWVLGLGLFFTALSLLVRALLCWAPLSGGSGIPQIRAELLGRVHMAPVPTLVSKFIGGATANLVGLSVGREGPSIQLGGATGKLLARVFGSRGAEINYLIAAGASAGLAAAFNAPIAGVLFTIEELYGSFAHALLVPALIASVAANAVSFALMGQVSSFTFNIEVNLPLSQLAWVAVLGLVAGLVGISFNLLLEGMRRGLSRLPWVFDHLIWAVFLITIPVAYLMPAVLGGGHGLIESLVDAPASMSVLGGLLLAKLVYTCLSYNSGVQGGIFLPVLVLGALTGAIVFRLSGLPDTYLVNFIALGMAGVLTAVVRAPLMSVILVVEMTGSFSQLLMITVAAFCAYQLAEWLRVIPVYETLYANLLAKQGQPAAVEGFSEPVLSEFILVEEPSYLQQPLQDLDFPVRLLITEVQREGISFTPQGSDQLHAQDRLKVLHDARDSEVISHFFKGH